MTGYTTTPKTHIVDLDYIASEEIREKYKLGESKVNKIFKCVLISQEFNRINKTNYNKIYNK